MSTLETPYPPSWIDRFGEWVETRRVPAWVIYAGLGAALIAGQLLLFWLLGGGAYLELAPVVVFNSLLIAFLLGLMHLLDRWALSALQTMRPILEISDGQYNRYRYELATMPLVGSLAAGLVMMVIVILMETFVVSPERYGGLAQLPLFNVIFQIVDKGSAFLFGVFAYHTVRQLRLVRAITTQNARISLFNPAPLQAFAPVTALTAVGLVITVYGWLLLNPDLLFDPAVIGFTAGATLLAVAVFVLPLYGVHRRMKAEKERLLLAVDLEMETLFGQFNEALQAGDHDALDRLNGTINSLGFQRARIDDLPSWPWRAGTARAALSAITLPLLAQVVRLLAGQLLGV